MYDDIMFASQAKQLSSFKNSSLEKDLIKSLKEKIYIRAYSGGYSASVVLPTTGDKIIPIHVIQKVVELFEQRGYTVKYNSTNIQLIWS